MNHKAIEDPEVQELKMEKEEPIGTSHMGTTLIIAIILGSIILLLLFYLIISIYINSSQETSSVLRMFFDI